VLKQPITGSQLPAARQGSLVEQVIAEPPAHTPDWHDSPCVHAFPSLQLVPFAAVGFEHAPLLGLHVPATWHWSLAAHVTGFDPVQMPAWHESLCVHAFPSLQLVPFEAVGFEHAPVLVLHVPARWH
jgi:hypothetical protein